jgi:hypothetical protein
MSEKWPLLECITFFLRNFFYVQLEKKVKRCSPDGSFNEGGHDGQSETTSRHNKDLDELAFAFEVLSDH